MGKSNMFEEKVTTARQGAKRFTELMRTKPECWGENLYTSFQNIKDVDEQMLFLKFLADPQNKTNLKDRVVQTRPMTDRCCFDNTDLYEVTERVPGECPLIKIRYRVPVEDEKQEEKSED